MHAGRNVNRINAAPDLCPDSDKPDRDSCSCRGLDLGRQGLCRDRGRAQEPDIRDRDRLTDRVREEVRRVLPEVAVQPVLRAAEAVRSVKARSRDIREA